MSCRKFPFKFLKTLRERLDQEDLKTHVTSDILRGTTRFADNVPSKAHNIKYIIEPVP